MRRCATTTGWKSTGRSSSTRRKRGASATSAPRPAEGRLLAVGRDDVVGAPHFFGAALVVEHLALALVVRAGDALTRFQRRQVAAGTPAVFGALLGELLVLGLGLGLLLLLG